MQMQIESRHLNGDVAVLRPEVFEDERGFFMEVFRADQYAELGLPTQWVQENHSRSSRGVLRGLHFQWDPPMGKFMRVARGEALIVAVDIRPGSPTLGEHVTMVANDENHLALWAPASFARRLSCRCTISACSTKARGMSMATNARMGSVQSAGGRVSN